MSSYGPVILIIHHFSQKQHNFRWFAGSFDRWATTDAACEHGTSRERPVDSNFGIHGGGKKDLGRSNRWGKPMKNRRFFFQGSFARRFFESGEVMMEHKITWNCSTMDYCVFMRVGDLGPHLFASLIVPRFCEEFASANWELFKECWGRPTRYAWIWGSSKWTNCWDARRRASRTNRSSDEMQLHEMFRGCDEGFSWKSARDTVKFDDKDGTRCENSM